MQRFAEEQQNIGCQHFAALPLRLCAKAFSLFKQSLGVGHLRHLPMSFSPIMPLRGATRIENSGFRRRPSQFAPRPYFQ